MKEIQALLRSGRGLYYVECIVNSPRFKAKYLALLTPQAVLRNEEFGGKEGIGDVMD